MTVFDFEREVDGDWFPFFSSRLDMTTGEVVYDEPLPDAAEFCIRSMGPFFEQRRKNRKREHKMVLNPKSGSMERVSYYPDLPGDEAEKEMEDAWDYAITGMRNAFSAPGVPIECNRENKLKLIKMPQFLRFANRVFEILSGNVAAEKEASEKN